MSEPVASLIETSRQVDFELSGLPVIPPPNRVLMVEPSFYDVEYVINSHMAGNVGRVDRFSARRQWRAVAEAYRSIGVELHAEQGQPFLPDYVFCANQCLPVPPGLLSEGPAAVMSIMRSARRAPEVAHVEAWLTRKRVHLERLDLWTVPSFEGTGDACWHPGRALLWGGVGPRTSIVAYRHIAAWTSAPVAVLELVDPRFYHLDTALTFLDPDTAVLYPGAFTDEGNELIAALIPRRIEVDESEAMSMACNGHCPDGRHFIVQSGNRRTAAAVRELGFEVIEVQTSEFLLSGGSVYCMKLHLWT